MTRLARSAAPGLESRGTVALFVATLLAGGCAAPPPAADPSPAPRVAPPPATSPPAGVAVTAMPERLVRMGEEAETRGLAEPYRGIVFGGAMTPNLFPIRSTGVSTEPVRVAVDAFLAALTPAQRAKTTFAADDPEWRKWMNQHFYARQGVGFEEMSEAQRDAAFAMLRASLSAKGLRTTRDIMRLNHTLGELNDDDFVQYGEWKYWITVMGTPSATEPWGWQLDGHHVIINYFVLGDQVVMTPTFMGSEPVTAPSGKYTGTTVLQAEQNKGLAMIAALTDAQRAKAVLALPKTGTNNVSEAFKDNLSLEYIGIRATELSAPQKARLLDLIEEYVSHQREGHARVKMDEVRRHVDDTWFGWIGGTDARSVFYYRIQSPVVLIEFDHQQPIAMRELPRGVPTRQHIHTVIRTPNGNDYGKDLLRQHHARHPHPSGGR
jgi:hypothetical protein